VKRLKLRIPGPVGLIETVVDDPEGARAGLVLIAHPHPLQGGSLDNKVVATLAKVATEHGHVAVRPNFRGVGQSEGAHDQGMGEADDLQAVIDFVSPHYAELGWVLAGFSFGAYVQHRLARRGALKSIAGPSRGNATPRLILIAPAVGMYDFDALPANSVVIHGGEDELFPLHQVQSWAAEQGARLAIIDGAGHFFHGKLRELASVFADACSCETRA
jgi:alpha/beta superfamily hydrolase